MSENYQKPSLNVGTSTYFTEEGGAGFGMSRFSDRLFIKCWKKGAESSKDKNNNISLNNQQAMYLNKALAYICMNRVAAYNNKQEYPNITDFHMNVIGMINGAQQVLSTIRFDTVQVNGINRIRITFTKSGTVNSITFCERFTDVFGPNVDVGHDVADASFFRFCNEVNEYVNNSWMFAAFDSIYGVIRGGKSGGNSTPNTNGGGRNSSYSNYKAPDEDRLPFDDDEY